MAAKVHNNIVVNGISTLLYTYIIK